MNRCVSCLIAAWAASIASAGLIPIVNAGFENPSLGSGQFTTTIPGWITGASGMGVFNPTPAAYAGGAAPEGENVAWSNDASGFASQALGATLEPFTRYTLSMFIGNRLDNFFAGYRFELRAAGNVVAFEQNAVVPGDGQFALRSVVFETGATHPDLGGGLEIRFRAGGAQTNFDDVRLLADVIPAPSSVVILCLPAGVPRGRRRQLA